jgi:hypothetical protein
VSDDVSRRPRELEERYFDLMSRANRPDIVYDEDGPRWGDTYTEAESPSLNAAVDEAEQGLEDFLRANREALERDRHWAGYYPERDAEGGRWTGRPPEDVRESGREATP